MKIWIQLAILLVACQVTQAEYYKPIPESMKNTGGFAGIALSISNNSLNFLKQSLVPYFWSKVEFGKQPDQQFVDSNLTLTYNLTNIAFQLPLEEGDTDNWKALLHNDTGSV